MKFKKQVIFVLWGILTFLTLGGCSSKPPMISKPVENTWTLEAPIENLWKSGIEALVDKGVQVDILDKETGLIVVVENFDGSSFNQYVAEPYSFYAGQARVNILLTKKNETNTQVTIKSAMFGLGRTYVPAKVTSNGKLERDYYLVIAGCLPKGKTYKWLEDVEPLAEKK